MTLTEQMDDYSYEKLLCDVRHAEEARRVCDLCGEPLLQERHVHANCADYEQFLADREPLEVVNEHD